MTKVVVPVNKQANASQREDAVAPDEIILGLDRLREAWARTSAGRGGYAALAGFDFQIARAILETIKSESTGGGLVLMEVLSDIVRQEGGLVVAQLKRTLSSATLIKALEELWAIEQLARSTAPRLLGAMRYEVQAARRILKDAGTSISRWTPPGADPAELSVFKSRLHVRVTASPRLEAARLLVDRFADPKPFHTIDQWSGRLLRAADGAAMEAASEEIRIELAALKASAGDREAEFHLWGLEDRAPADVQFEPDPRRAVRVGQRLTLGDLTAGRLADRRVYGDLHLAVEDWLRGLNDSADKLSAFWIEGRSGSGKSAALLHLLSKIHDENPQRVIVWLGSRGERFGDAMRRFSDVVEGGGRLIIATDDPFSPDLQDRFVAATQKAAEVWTRLNGSGNRDADAPPPVLICCGPTEQREFGEDRCYAELDIRAWTLPKERPEDLTELADWYSSRTGTAPPDVEGDALLVQRFFEWNKGKIRDFALRFRSRLRAFSGGDDDEFVFETVARILAFGRLYADYPASVLNDAIRNDPRLGKAFDQLAESEAHLVFQPEGDGVRMTHPHLADAIYREWFGRPGDRHARRLHLLDGFRTSMGREALDPEVRLAPLWAIARLVRSREGVFSRELRERVTLIDGELGDILPALYADLKSDLVPLTDLPVWLVLDEALHLGLSPAPRDRLEAAVSDAAEPARGLRLSCHVLLEHDPSLEPPTDPRTVVAGLLNKLVDYRGEDDLPWRDWAFVTANLIRRGGSELILDAILRLIDKSPQWRGLGIVVQTITRDALFEDAKSVGLAWLSATQDTPWHWSGVLRILQDRSLASPEFGEFVYRYLLTMSRHRSWAAVWESTLASGLIAEDKLLDLSLAWLGVRRQMGFPIAGFDSRGYDRIWVAAYRLAEGEERQVLADIGLGWLREVDTAAQGWSHVWSALWATDDLEAEVRSEVQVAGLIWLETHRDYFAWSFIWHAFFNAPRELSKTALRDIAVTWLGVVWPGHSGWPYVWETLWRSSINDDQSAALLQIGETWLEQATESRGWWAVFEHCVRDEGARRDRMLALGKAWVQTTSPDHPGLGFVAQELISHLKKDGEEFSEVVSAAGLWLARNILNPVWPRLFNFFAQFLPVDQFDNLLRKAESAGNEPNQLKPALLNVVIQNTRDPVTRSRIIGLLASWIDGHFLDREWSTAWHIIVRAEPRPLPLSTMLSLVADWSAEVGPRHQSWPFVWPTWAYFLRKEGHHETLQTRMPDVLACLLSLSVHHKKWPHLWLTLLSAKTDLTGNPDLIISQAEWLRKPISEPQTWGRIFRHHQQHVSSWIEDTVLTDRLFDWLSLHLFEQAAWPTLWAAARRVPGKGSIDLQDEAMVWLRTVDMAQPAWKFVWRGAVRAPGARRDASPELFNLAERWLIRTPVADTGWSVVFGTVRQFAPQRAWSAEFVASLEARLPSAPAGVAVALRTVLKGVAAASAPGDDGSLRPQASSGVPRPPSEEASAFAKLVETSAVEKGQWLSAWRAYLPISTPALRNTVQSDQALAWLEGPGASHTSWPWVWRDLWRHWPNLNPHLVRVGRDWLRGRPHQTPGRNLVQNALFGPGSELRKRKTPKA